MRKQVIVCDSCGSEAVDGGTMRANYDDARRGSKAADLCSECMAKLPGKPVARRGRRPKALSAA